MPIILKCSSCQAQLEVDDAFASGICRCVHCGALSHVPSQPTRMDRNGRPLAPPPMAAPAVATAEAEHVYIAPTREFAAEKKRGLMALILLALAALMLVGVLVLLKFLLTADKQRTKESVEGEARARLTEKAAVVKKGPNFAGLDIPGRQVAYLVNGGSRELFDGMTAAVEVSIGTLGPRKFLVSVWPEGGGVFFGEVTPSKPAEVFPADGVASADSSADRAGLAGWFAGQRGGQRRDPLPAVEAALARGADTIVLISPTDLTDEQVQAIQAKLADKKAALLVAYVLERGADESPPGLAKLAPDPKHRAVVREDELAELIRLSESAHAGMEAPQSPPAPTTEPTTQP